MYLGALYGGVYTTWSPALGGRVLPAVPLVAPTLAAIALRPRPVIAALVLAAPTLAPIDLQPGAAIAPIVLAARPSINPIPLVDSYERTNVE